LAPYALLLIAAFIAYSRVYIGVHYPLDILCGILVGSIIGFTFYKVWKRVIPRFLD